MISFLSISLFMILAVLSPGPDFIVVTKNTMSYNKQAGSYTAIGVTCGAIILSSVCLSGLILIVLHSSRLFDVLKIIGFAYLSYLGVKLLCSKKEDPFIESYNKSKPIKSFKAFKEGLLVSTLNPKAWLFFATLFTMIVNTTSSIYFQSLYAVEVSVFYFIWFLVVVMLFDHHIFKKRIIKFQFYLKKLFGVLLLFFAVLIIRSFFIAA